MKVPGGLFLESLESKKTYWFSINPPAGIAEHYHICVTKTEEDLVIFACCTSQEDTMNKLIAKQNLSASTIVYIPKGKFNFTQNTFVNCNNVFTMSTDEFVKYYNTGGVDFKSEIDLHHYKQIVDGIKESKLVEREIKNMIPDVE